MTNNLLFRTFSVHILPTLLGCSSQLYHAFMPHLIILRSRSLFAIWQVTFNCFRLYLLLVRMMILQDFKQVRLHSRDQ